MNKFKVGQIVLLIDDDPIDGKNTTGVVKEVHDDHIIVDAPSICDHMWYDEDMLDLVKIIK